MINYKFTNFQFKKGPVPLLLSALTATILMGIALPSLAAEICITAESDPDGDGYGWEQEATCLVTAASSEVPAFFDPRSGEQRVIQRIQWVTADFANKSFAGCQGYLSDPSKDEDECLTCGSDEKFDYQHYGDGNGRLIYSYGNINFEADFTWGIDDYGIYFGPLPITGFAEITDNGIRQWLAGSPGEIGFYEHCEGAMPSTIQQAVAIEPGVVVPDGDTDGDTAAEMAADAGSSVGQANLNGNGIIDVVVVANSGSADTNGDGINDLYALPIDSSVTAMDENNNGIDDSFEVALTGGVDLNSDGIDDAAVPSLPDISTGGALWEADLNDNGIIDAVEPANTGVADTNSDNIDDRYAQPVDSNVTPKDENTNGIDDSFEVALTGGSDLDSDGIDDAAAAQLVVAAARE